MPPTPPFGAGSITSSAAPTPETDPTPSAGSRCLNPRRARPGSAPSCDRRLCEQRVAASTSRSPVRVHGTAPGRRRPTQRVAAYCSNQSSAVGSARELRLATSSAAGARRGCASPAPRASCPTACAAPRAPPRSCRARGAATGRRAGRATIAAVGGRRRASRRARARRTGPARPSASSGSSPSRCTTRLSATSGSASTTA